MTEITRRNVYFLILLAVCLFSLNSFYRNWKGFWVEREQAVSSAISAAGAEVDLLAADVRNDMDGIAPVVRLLAEELEAGSVDRATLIERLQRDALGQGVIAGMGVAFLPWTESDEFRESSPFYVQGIGVQTGSDRIETAAKSYFFSEPDENGRRMPRGVVFADMDLRVLESKVFSRAFGRSGYGFVLGPDGRFLYHPLDGPGRGYKTIFELAAAGGIDALDRAGRKAVLGETFSIEYDNPATGEPEWVVVRPTNSSGWSVGAVFKKKEMVSAAESMGRARLARFCLAGVFFFTTLVALLFGAHRGPEWRLWVAAGAFSLVAFVAAGFVWDVTSGGRTVALFDGVPVRDAVSVESFSRRMQMEFDSAGREMREVETGVFVQALDFSGPHEIEVSGYVRQVYDGNFPDGMQHGFVMPDAVFFRRGKSFVRVEGNHEIVGWYFEARLKQDFDYTGYPMDSRIARIRIRHAEPGANILLRPSGEALAGARGGSPAGLKRNFNIPGWLLKRSFFSYADTGFTTAFSEYTGPGGDSDEDIPFGILDKGATTDPNAGADLLADYISDRSNAPGGESVSSNDDATMTGGVEVLQLPTPDLVLNIKVKRIYEHGLLAAIMPVFAVCVVLFALLLATRDQVDRAVTPGVWSTIVIVACAAAAAGISIAGMRFGAPAGFSGATVVEFVLIAGYAAVFWTAFYAVATARRGRGLALKLGGNLLPSLLFWPFVMLVLLVVSLLGA